jgi:hypothetical protein
MPFAVSVAKKKYTGTPHLKPQFMLLKTAYSETSNHAFLPTWTN